MDDANWWFMEEHRDDNLVHDGALGAQKFSPGFYTEFLTKMMMLK